MGIKYEIAGHVFVDYGPVHVDHIPDKVTGLWAGMRHRHTMTLCRY